MNNASRIGIIGSGGTPCLINTPTVPSNPAGIVVAPDGHVWITEFTAGKIGKVSQGTTCAQDGIAEFPIPTANSGPARIALGPDGNLWFTESAVNKIGRITTSGTITEFPLPAANSQPWAISGFYDGTIWFTERAASKIAQINTSGRVLQEILTPTLNSQPQSLVIGPDGNLWFTEQAGDILGRLAGGTITEFAIPTVGSMPGDAVVGPDGALWFTEQAGNKIGKFTPLSNTPLLASMLPSSRSPEVPHAAAAFATIINSGSSAATGCAIAPLQYVPVSSFQYQTTNPATNALTGTVNTPSIFRPGSSRPMSSPLRRARLFRRSICNSVSRAPTRTRRRSFWASTPCNIRPRRQRFPMWWRWRRPPGMTASCTLPAYSGRAPLRLRQ